MRLSGWDKRLRDVVEAAEARPYSLGEWDCFRMACAVVQALTGADRWPEWQGQYRDLKSALRLLARHGSTFEAAFDWFFQVQRSTPFWARRGDICALATEDGQKHLGVCLGAETAFLGPTGLVRVPTLTCLCAWRVG